MVPPISVLTKENVMNEHSIREIARVAYEAHNEYTVVALGHDRKDWDELSDDTQDEFLAQARGIIEVLSVHGQIDAKLPTEKVFLRVIKALANSERLL